MGIAIGSRAAYAAGMLSPALRPVLFFCFASAALAAPDRYTLRHAGQLRAFEPVMEGSELVLYEPGRQRTVHTRRGVTGDVLVRLASAAEAPVLAALSGAASWRAAPAPGDAVILSFPGPATVVLAAAESLRGRGGVISAEPILSHTREKRWTPNDPFFADNPANAGYAWHLKNTGGPRGGIAGVDVNISPVWDFWRGAGIRIGILDDGLQTAHPDLAANVDTLSDFDWNGNDGDPSPGSTFDRHGTACAGVAAGRGNNGIGLCGAAPEATLVGLRLISPSSTDTTEAAAFLHQKDIIQIKNNSWGPSDNGSTVEGPGTMAAAALEQATATGRGGLGTIITWAAGNGLAFGDDANYDGYANSIYTIAVTSVTDGGLQPSSAEPGANILIAAPSSGGAQKISTTDLTGANGFNAGGGGNYASPDYTNGFDGTSSATALLSGCVAVLLQSKPSLGWRDVKEILLRTATKNHPADSGWFTNGAGYHFNDKYGAGLVNMQAAVSLAAGWKNLAAMISSSVSSPGGLAIPDNSPAGAVKSFSITAAANLRVEQVAVNLSITHPRRGQLNYTLTSPSGTVSRLARPRNDSFANLNGWTFTTPHFWGEPAQGTWTLRVSDTIASNTGSITAAVLTLYGSGLDADGDGFTADFEDWFGTSDTSAASSPAPLISLPGGTGTITFPSVAGRTYTVEASADLLIWTSVNVPASGSTTVWADPSGPSIQRRYYRVKKP